MSVTEPPNPSGRILLQVKAETTVTYWSVRERRTMSWRKNSQEVRLNVEFDIGGVGIETVQPLGDIVAETAVYALGLCKGGPELRA